MQDHYWTIKADTIWEVKIERSLFIARTKEVNTEQEAKEFIQQVSQEHKQATHNCSGYRIGWSKNEATYSDDDGEPSGTAGKPILGAILSSGLTNVAIVVTRYFGGKKLGVRGLIEAYGGAAREVIEQAGKQEKILQDNVQITCLYPQLNQVLYWLEKYQAEINKRDYTEEVNLQFAIRQRDKEALVDILKDYGTIEE